MKEVLVLTKSCFLKEMLEFCNEDIEFYCPFLKDPIEVVTSIEGIDFKEIIIDYDYMNSPFSSLTEEDWKIFFKNSKRENKNIVVIGEIKGNNIENIIKNQWPKAIFLKKPEEIFNSGLFNLTPPS